MTKEDAVPPRKTTLDIELLRRRCRGEDDHSLKSRLTSFSLRVHSLSAIFGSVACGAASQIWQSCRRMPFGSGGYHQCLLTPTWVWLSKVPFRAGSNAATKEVAAP